jgi:predicted AAA+ superfamily ATPase
MLWEADEHRKLAMIVLHTTVRTFSGRRPFVVNSFLAADDKESFEWRSTFIQTYLERDVPALGPRIPAETLRRYWQMLAHN